MVVYEWSEVERSVGNLFISHRDFIVGCCMKKAYCVEISGRQRKRRERLVGGRKDCCCV